MSYPPNKYLNICARPLASFKFFSSIFLFSSSIFYFCYSVKAVWPCGQIMQGREIREISSLFQKLFNKLFIFLSFIPRYLLTHLTFRSIFCFIQNYSCWKLTKYSCTCMNENKFFLLRHLTLERSHNKEKTKISHSTSPVNS